jgi:hypothetical protein
MKIYDVVNEVGKNPISWIGGKLADRAARKAAEKAAEAAIKAERELIAKELDRYAGPIEDLARQYAKDIIKAEKKLGERPLLRDTGTPPGSSPIKKDWLDDKVPELTKKDLAVQEAIRKKIKERADELEGINTGRIKPEPKPAEPKAGDGVATTPPAKDPKKTKQEPEAKIKKPKNRQPSDRSTVMKWLGAGGLILQGWGALDVTITFLQESERIDHAMIDETNPLSPEEANKLHQRIQYTYLGQLTALAVAPKLMKLLGYAGVFGGAAMGGVIGYAITAHNPDATEANKWAGAVSGSILGGAINPTAKLIVDKMFKLGPQAWPFFLSLGTKAGSPLIAEWMSSKEGYQWICGLLSTFFEVPTRSSNDLFQAFAAPNVLLGTALNTIRAGMPTSATEFRRGMYQVYYDWLGKDMDVPTIDSGKPINPADKIDPTGIRQAATRPDSNPASTPNNTVTKPNVAAEPENKQSGQQPPSRETDDDAAAAERAYQNLMKR